MFHGFPATPAAAAVRRSASDSRFALWVWLLLGTFIVYGSLVPWDIVWDRGLAAARLAALSLNPLLSPDGARRASLPDVAQNVSLFAPFGLAGMIALRRQWPSAPTRVMCVTALAALLSATVETLQLFTVNRVTSVGDLFFDTVGAFAGALSAGPYQRSVRSALGWVKASKIADAPALYPTCVAAVILCIAAWHPFDVTIEAGAIWGKVKAIGRDPWQVHALTDEGLELLRYLLFTASAAVWLRQIAVRAPMTKALAVGVAAAVGLEGSQFFFESRMPGIEDALVHSAGAVAGVALVSAAAGVGSLNLWLILLLAATFGGAALQALSPLTAAPKGAGLVWAPLVAYRNHPPLEGLSHFVEVALPYLPVGFALALTVRSLSQVWIRAATAAVVLSLPIVLMQGWIGSQPADVSDVAVAVAACVAGAWLSGVGFVKFSRWLVTAQRPER
jgi:VanZ family protein